MSHVSKAAGLKHWGSQDPLAFKKIIADRLLRTCVSIFTAMEIKAGKKQVFMRLFLNDNEPTVLTEIMHFFLMKNSSVLKPAK